VISVWDAESIYTIPWMLHQQMLDEIVCHKLGIIARPADLRAWKKLVDALQNPQHEITIAWSASMWISPTLTSRSNEALVQRGDSCAPQGEHPLCRRRRDRRGGAGTTLKAWMRCSCPGLRQAPAWRDD